jgi:hypothetical protein
MNKKIIGLSVALTLLCLATTFAPAASAREVSMQSATGAASVFTSSGFLKEFAFTVREYSDDSVRGRYATRSWDAPPLPTRLPEHPQRNLAIARRTVTPAENPSLRRLGDLQAPSLRRRHRPASDDLRVSF